MLQSTLSSVIDDYQQLSNIIDVCTYDDLHNYLQISLLLPTCYIAIFYTHHNIMYCLKIKTNGFQTLFGGNGNQTFSVF